jgi:CRISPR-associated endonuclease Cas1
MAASSTLPHSSPAPQISNSGTLTLYGFGIRITMQAGHLQVEFGVGHERRRLRLPRVNHRLRRLVCIGDDGFVTLAALRWLSDVGASFAMLDRLGKVRVVTGPASPSEARLRRAQALALGNGNAVKIARELISAKLSAQEVLVREKLKNTRAADSIAALQVRLGDATDLNAIRGTESLAAAKFWDAWRDLPILFPRKDVGRVPSHWLTFGPRHSPLTGGPRLSVNPANSLLNYTNAVAESECRLAACACGLDPGLGILHTDTANRDSLALDLIEPIRPAIEAWLLDWLMHEPLRRSDFVEAGDGNCRLSSTLCSKLSETAPTWGRLVAPWAEYVARALWTTASPLKVPATRLTQQHRREAKGSSPLAPDIPTPRRDNLCRGCGKTIRRGRADCAECAVGEARERLAKAAMLGRVAARSLESRAKHSATRRRHAQACTQWKASSHPEWLTAKLYSEKIQPLLTQISSSAIAKQIGVSRWYAGRIREGYRPHPRHWQALARLVKFMPDPCFAEKGTQ